MPVGASLLGPEPTLVDGREAISTVLAGGAQALLIEFDQAGAVVASVLLAGGDGPAQAVCAPGVTIESLVGAGPLAESVRRGLEAVERGGVHTAELDGRGQGEPAWTRLMMVPRYKGHGRRRGFSLVLMNVTDARRGAQALRVARERLSAILNSAADGIVVIDADGRIEDANPAAAAVFGWPVEELVGRPVTCLMDEPYSAFHGERMERYLATGVSGILNVGPRPLPARRRDGSPVSIELSIGEVSIGGERRFIGICREIGDRLRRQEELREANRALAATVEDLRRARDDLNARRKAADDLAAATEAARKEAEAASLAKSRFLAKASHELRTPLNGILAVAELLSAKVPTGEARELAEVVAGSTRDLVALLNEVLDLSSLELGAVTLKPAPFSLAGLVDQAAAVWSAAAAAKGLEFVRRGPDADVWLCADRARLTQVLSNLLGNAVKFTAHGRVTLEVEAVEREPGCVAVRIAVADTGPGLDEEVRARLFEPFVHAASTVARRGAGAGLGLSICRELVDLMGGRLQAEPAQVGARMTVELELPAAAEAPPAEAAGRPAAEGLTALVVDDHPVNRQVMGLLLDQIGVPHAFAEDGVAAVEAAASGRFGLVLMDIQMPRMDGVAAAAAIRGFGGAAGATPIVAVTAHAEVDTPRFQAARFDAVIEKPITVEAVARAIATATGCARGARGEERVRG